MTHAEDRLLGACREPIEGGGIACGGLGEALAAREAIGPRMCVLPLPVVGERAAFELTDSDVVEVLVDDLRNLRRAAAEGEGRRLLGSRETRGDADVDRQRRELHAERLGSPAAGVGEAPIQLWIAVHEPGDVEDRLTVASKDEQAHREDATWLEEP